MPGGLPGGGWAVLELTGTLCTAMETRFSNLTILNTYKQRTDKLCLIAVAKMSLQLSMKIENATLTPSKKSDFKMSRCVCWV